MLGGGKPIRDTFSGDVPLEAKTIQWFAETIDKVYGEVGPSGPVKASVPGAPTRGSLSPWRIIQKTASGIANRKEGRGIGYVQLDGVQPTSRKCPYL